MDSRLFHGAKDIPVLTILSILAEQGQVARIVDDLFLHAEALAAAKQAIRRLARTSEGITVGSVRDATGSSRKYVLPLLEYLDTQKFTVRQGDNRILAESERGY